MSLLDNVTNDQKYFGIERLLFQLHLLNEVRLGSLDFDSVARLFVEQVQKWFRGFAGDHTRFIVSLKKKVAVLRGDGPEEVDVPLSPPMRKEQIWTSPPSAGAHSMRARQLTPYSRLSSWSSSYPTSHGHRQFSSTAGARGSSTGTQLHSFAPQSTGLPSIGSGVHMMPSSSSTSGSSGHRVFQASGWSPVNIWQPRATFYTPIVEQQPETSVEDAQMWLTQACHDLKLAQQLVDLVQRPVASATEAEQDGGTPSTCEYPEAVCFYSHEIVEKALKAVFLAYCGLKHELAASSNVVDLFEKLKNSTGCPEEVKNTDEFIHLVSRHGRCCRFPDDNLPPAAPVISHSTATAKETLSAALKFLKAVSKLQLFRDYFPNDTLEINIERLTRETDTPYYWDKMPEEKEYDLFAVLEEKPEYQQVARLFRGTLPSAKIVRIERIQNKVLWDNYQQKKKHLERIVSARDVDLEKLLFHGTRTTAPETIYAGEVGFDMRRSAQGMWGEGCYFAVNASYSQRYAHRLSSGWSQMLVARVLTGGATHDDKQRGKVLPIRTSSDRRKGQIERQYTCVCAFTGGSEIYVTKENFYAYPEYLITFQ